MSKAIIVMWFLAAGLMLLATQAVGQESTSAAGNVPALKLSWSAPQTRVNGAPITLDEIKNYQLRCSQEDGASFVKGIRPTGQDQNYSEPKADLFPDYGSYSCTLEVVDTEGRTSAPSEPVTADWDKPTMPPAVAPSDLRIVAQPNKGDTVKLLWESPVTRTDGSAVKPGAMDYYTVMCNGFNTGNSESLVTIPVDGSPTTEIKRTELFASYGDYKCRAKVTMQDGADSAWSEYVRVNWRDAPPAPVTNVLVVVDSK